MDANQPVMNPTLAASIKAMQENPSPANSTRFFAELLSARFLTPVVITPVPQPDDGSATIPANTTIGFETLTNEDDDKSYFMAFTDWVELGKWKNVENQQTLVLTFKDFQGLVMDENAFQVGVIINPTTDNILLDKAYFLNTGEGRGDAHSSYTVEKDTEVFLGEPKVYPQALVDALKGHFTGHSGISKAYLLLMCKDNQFSYLIVLDFVGDRDEVFDDVGHFAVSYLSKDEYIDIVSAQDAFGKDAIEGRTAFYVRGIHG